MNRTADAFEDESFDAADEFVSDDAFAPLEPADTLSDDPFLGAESIERRMLGDDDGFGDASEAPLAEAPGGRPFGARLADANRDSGFDEDFSGYEPAAPMRPAARAPQQPVAAAQAFGDEETLPLTTPLGAGGMSGEIAAVSAPDESLLNQPVPRIAIHAFCESPETGRLVHHAAEDRRMARTHVTVELGGLSAAIERFHDESTPELLILETGMRGRELFQQLDDLAAVCDSDTKVIIIGAANDISLYRELIKRGVSEYLVPPMTPLHLISTVSGLFLDPEAPFAGRSIAFIGAKGGVGSSTIAHNVAWQMTEGLRSDAVLVDLDLSFGTAGLDFNQDPAQTIAMALEEPDRLDDALLDRLLVRCTERLSLFSAPATLERDWDFQPEAFETVLDKVRRQAPFVALDLPHAWSPWVRHTLLSADQVVVTVTPDLASLRNAKNLFDLVQSARPNDEPPKVVVNMAGCPKKPDIPLKDFSDALGAAPVLVLPFEPALFGKAANNGQMIAEVDPKSKASDGFAHLAAQLTGRAPAAPRRKSLFGSLFGKG